MRAILINKKAMLEKVFESSQTKGSFFTPLVLKGLVELRIYKIIISSCTRGFKPEMVYVVGRNNVAIIPYEAFEAGFKALK